MFDLFKRKAAKVLKPSRDTWFGKVVGLFDRPSLDEALWEELEELLIAADVGVNTTTKLINKVRERVKKSGTNDVQQVRNILKEEMIQLLTVNGENMNEKQAVEGDNGGSPWVVLVMGVNGSGKTTSIAKLANSYRGDGKEVLLAAADTFRAAAIDQLQWWGKQINADVIAHQPGADPGAVVFDSLQAAKNRGVKVVIIDTAGRLHTKFNLMEELKKIKRVAQRIDPSAPHETLLVLDATTGQNGLTQAINFTKAMGISGIILTKLDSTARGGIVLAISDQLNIPIKYVGTGEKQDDLALFDPKTFVEALMS